MLRYIKYTLNYELRFSKSGNGLKLLGYCDSDFASSIDRFSTSGYCFMLNSKGPLLSWRSQKQKTVALSSCEAEYVSLACCVQEAKFLRQLLLDMYSIDISVAVFCDNLSAMSLASNPVMHKRSKHIDVKYHYIRNELKEGFFSLSHVPSCNNVADLFTKPVTRNKLVTFSCLKG